MIKTIADVKRWLYALDRSHMSVQALDDESKKRLLQLKQLTDQFCPLDDNGRRTFWIEMAPYSFEDFKNKYEQDEECYCDDDYNEDELTETDLKEWFDAEYSPDTRWVKIECLGHTRRDGTVFYGVFVNSKYVVSVNDPNERGYPMDATEFIDWLEVSIKKVKKMVNNNTYEMFLKGLPHTQMEGRVLRADLWNILPAVKENYLSHLTADEVNELQLYAGQERILSEPKMTARRFFEACAVVYDALELPSREYNRGFKETEEERGKYGGITPKEKYYSHADGRDDGLINVPLDDPNAFADWYVEKGPYFEFNGRHPWEIIPSFSINFSLHLYVNKEQSELGDVYYFTISGSSYTRSIDTIKGYLALCEAGYPVRLYDSSVLINRVIGSDYIGIVKENNLIMYSSEIAGERVYDYISLAEFRDEPEVLDEITKAAIWEDEPVARLIADYAEKKEKSNPHA